MDAIVEMQGLSKVYKRGRSLEPVVAVNNLALKIGVPGTVHGFLGPNGSGKTTSIRCMLGLIRPTSGIVKLFGADSATDFYRVAPRVGAIVENPKMFPAFTGRKNLRLLADIQGVSFDKVEEMLGVVGLSDRGDDTFDSYSLGMKQRLAIAGALLKDPDLLILDEPANGLDPAGIAEMRVLIRSIASQGKAVIVSSHQLSEIEQVCDDITIISLGNLIVSDSLDAIRESHPGRQGVIVEVEGREQAMQTLASAGFTSSLMPKDGQFFVDTEPARSAQITEILARSGQFVRGLASQTATLEDIFLELTAPPPPAQAPVPGPPPMPAPSAGAAQ